MTRISGYEWDLLEERGYLAGLSNLGWYEFFIATNDSLNLERLSTFYTPPTDSVDLLQSAEFEPSTPPTIELFTDRRYLELVAQQPYRMLGLSPRNFERFTAELLEKLGYSEVCIGSGTKDGGVDVSAFIKHPLGLEKIIVQCKRNTKKHKVGAPVIKQLLADTDIHGAARGLVVTTSSLTRGARLIVEERRHRLSAFDYDDLVAILRGEWVPKQNTAVTTSATR